MGVRCSLKRYRGLSSADCPLDTARQGDSPRRTVPDVGSEHDQEGRYEGEPSGEAHHAQRHCPSFAQMLSCELVG